MKQEPPPRAIATSGGCSVSIMRIFIRARLRPVTRMSSETAQNAPSNETDAVTVCKIVRIKCGMIEIEYHLRQMRSRWAMG